MVMSVRQRLRRLQRLHPPDSRTLWLVCVDNEGIVLDDGTAGVRPWIGKHYSAIPRIGKLIIGIDPLVVVGRKPAITISPRFSDS
jgi:hypothetical protein